MYILAGADIIVEGKITLGPKSMEPPKRELGKLSGRMTIHCDIVQVDFENEGEMNQ